MSKTERNGYKEQAVALAGSASNIKKMKQKSEQHKNPVLLLLFLLGGGRGGWGCLSSNICHAALQFWTQNTC